MALDTVREVLDDARAVLLDTIEPYRYSDVDLVRALNMGVMEMRRLRPDLLRLYFRASLPSFAAADLDALVPIAEEYRPALVYYVCGRAHMRDDEVTNDGRAAAFLNKFTAQLLTIQS